MPDHDDQLPDDLRALGERLRREAARPSGAELDELKLRATRDARAPGVRRHGRFVGSRLATILAIGLLGAGTGGTIAIAGSSGKSDNGSAAKHQYKPPGKGCGDKNHEHERKGECKDDDHGNTNNGGGKGGKDDKGKGNDAHSSKNDDKNKGKGDKAKTSSKTESKDKKHK
jgi:hypothetical protein